MSLKLRIDVPEGYMVEGYNKASKQYILQVRDETKNYPLIGTNCIVARLFEDGLVVMWKPNESLGYLHKFKDYAEARQYVENILRLGLIYENMPDIFARS